MAQTKAPAAYKANYERNRARERSTVRHLQIAATNTGLARLASVGSDFQVKHDSLGFFLPGSAILVWASPMVDYLKPLTLPNSFVRIIFAAQDYWSFAADEEKLLAGLSKIVSGSSGGHFRSVGWRVVEPPPVEWLWDTLPAYELDFDQPRELSVDDWGASLARMCQELKSLGLVADRFDKLDVSLICNPASPKCGPKCMEGPSDFSDEGSDRYCDAEPYLPPGSLADINALLGPEGSAERVFADVDMHYREWRYPITENL